MVAGSKRIIIGTSNWLINYVFYDHDRRPIQIRSNNHKNLAVDNLQTVVYDFEGKTLLAKTYHHAGTGNTTTVLNRFVYDTQGRLLKVYQTNNATAEQLVVQHEYNELGQVVDKKLHNTSGAEFLQSVDLRYNIRGWLTSINNAKLEANSTNNPDTDVTRDDFFGMELVYNGVDSALANTPRFNGNISAMKWKGIGPGSGSEDQSSYKFIYDKSNKLKSATSQMFNGTAWTKEAGALNESMTYDHNGNILGLQRSHRKHALNGLIASYVPETMDQLTYTYTTEFKDRLLKVTDGASNPVDGFSNGTSGTDNDYTYDDQGNITADKNKGIDSIHYNYLGKVRRIKFADGRVITYTYDAAGSKLTMKVCDGSTCTTTEYVGGFVYQDNVLSFFSSPGGRVVNKNNNLEYQYSIADQQGNTRVVFSSVLPQTQDGVTDFESDNGTLENFPSGGNLSSLTLFNRNSGTKSNLLNGGINSQVGVAKAYKVYPGDKVPQVGASLLAVRRYARDLCPTILKVFRLNYLVLQKRPEL